MRERSPHQQEHRRKPNKFGKSNKKRRQNKRFNNGNRAEADGNRARSGQSAEPGVCIKCGHPAPDGKLCAFHRSLLNSIRNDFGDRKGGGRQGANGNNAQNYAPMPPY